jgi:hypothetical protein
VSLAVDAPVLTYGMKVGVAGELVLYAARPPEESRGTTDSSLTFPAGVC